MERLHEYRIEDVEKFPVEQLCQLLSDLHYSTELLQNVRKNAVTGDVFLQLSDEQLKEIAPKLGDRVQLKKLQTELLRDAYEKHTGLHLHSMSLAPSAPTPPPSHHSLQPVFPEEVIPPPNPEVPDSYAVNLPVPLYPTHGYPEYPPNPVPPPQNIPPNPEVPDFYAVNPYPPVPAYGYSGYPPGPPQIVVVQEPAVTTLQPPQAQDQQDGLSRPCIYASFRCCHSCDECWYNVFYGSIVNLVLYLLFAPFVLPCAIMSLAYAYKAAKYNDGTAENYEVAKKFEKKANGCGFLAYWITIVFFAIAFACTILGIPVAIGILAIGILVGLAVEADFKKKQLIDEGCCV